MNRDGLLGRPRVGERLLPVEIAALDKPSETTTGADREAGVQGGAG